MAPFLGHIASGLGIADVFCDDDALPDLTCCCDDESHVRWNKPEWPHCCLICEAGEQKAVDTKRHLLEKLGGTEDSADTAFRALRSCNMAMVYVTELRRRANNATAPSGKTAVRLSDFEKRRFIAHRIRSFPDHEIAQSIKRHVDDVLTDFDRLVGSTTFSDTIPIPLRDAQS